MGKWPTGTLRIVVARIESGTVGTPVPSTGARRVARDHYGSGAQSQQLPTQAPSDWRFVEQVGGPTTRST